MPNDQDVDMEQEENVGAAAAEEGEPTRSASAEGDTYVSIRTPENFDVNALVRGYQRSSPNYHIH